MIKKGQVYIIERSPTAKTISYIGNAQKLIDTANKNGELIVSQWLGHSTSATTLRFYAHADKSSKMAIANALNAKKSA